MLTYHRIRMAREQRAEYALAAMPAEMRRATDYLDALEAHYAACPAGRDGCAVPDGPVPAGPCLARKDQP